MIVAIRLQTCSVLIIYRMIELGLARIHKNSRTGRPQKLLRPCSGWGTARAPEMGGVAMCTLHNTVACAEELSCSA